MNIGVRLLLVAFPCLVVSAPAFSQSYIVTPLIGNGSGDYASGINTTGKVVGFSYTNGPDAQGDLSYYPGQPAQATVWSGANSVYLNSLAGQFNAYGVAINASGQAAGVSCNSGNASCNAVIWNGATPTNLGSVGASGYVSSISNNGQVSGWATDSAGVSHATVWTTSATTTLAMLPGGGASYADGINDSGQVVGYTRISGSPDFEYDATSWTGNSVSDLGLLGGKASAANAINDGGQVAGYFITKGSNPVLQAAFWSGGIGHDLGTPGSNSEALALNDLGTVVGWADTGTGQDGVVWSNGKMFDLGLYGITSAVAINDNGQIVGDTFNGTTVLLTPEVTPIPASLLLFASGLLGFMCLSRRRECRSFGSR